MNPIALLRSDAGVTQRILATRAGTSQPTIALYESGAKSPTVATLQRLASSLGFELAVSFVPPLTREDRRSLCYHRAVAALLRKDPVTVIRKARVNLSKLARGHLEAAFLFNHWRVWLGLPVEELASRIIDPGMMARDMRQVTPFAGLLSAGDRVRILRRFREGRDT